MRHLSEPRDVTPVITGTFQIEALGAIKQRIYDLEKQYQNSLDAEGVSQNLDDISGATVVLTGNTVIQIYVFTLDAEFDTGTYTFAFEEKAPNVETATTL